MTTGELLPDGVITKRDEFTNTIHTHTWNDHLGAIPWVAQCGNLTPMRSCDGQTARGRQCKRKPRFLYVHENGGVTSFCAEHTQAALHGVGESRLIAWEKRVEFETDRYEEN